MKRYTALLLPAAIFLSSCDGASDKAPETATTAPLTQVATSNGSEKPDAEAPKLTGFAIGNYIDPTTYAVGGQGLAFKTTDNLYAVVGYVGVPANTEVSISVKGADGRDVTKVSRKTESDAQTSLTFDLEIPKKTQLVPGAYTFEASVAGSPALTQAVTIQ